jgi:hypothetical protein
LVTALIYARVGDDPPRSVMLLYNLFFNLNLNDPYLTVFNESGFRLISIYGGYIYGLVHPFGGGIGSWPVTSLVALEMTGVEAFEIYFYLEINEGFYYPTRPSAFASELFMEAGWVGFLLYSVAFFAIPRFRELIRNPFGRAVFFMFLFNFFVLGTIGDPIGTAVLGLTYVFLIKFKGELPDVENNGSSDLPPGSEGEGAPTPLSPVPAASASPSPTPGASFGFSSTSGANSALDGVGIPNQPS